jgi:hypothetical protein
VLPYLVVGAFGADVRVGDSQACPVAYILVPQTGIGPFNNPVKEISVAIDDGPFELKGKLFRRDWGAFNACGERLTIRVRNIAAALSVKGPKIFEVKDKVVVELRGRPKVFVELGWHWREVSPERGEALMREIEEKPGPPTPSGWNMANDRRNLYYAPQCYEVSDRCP